MDRGLRMNYHVDLVRAHPKEPACFDDFEAFVHHRGRINGDAVSHAPVGMRKRLFDRDVRQRGQRRLSKRTARRRSEEHTSELQSRLHLVCRLLLEKKKCPRAVVLPLSDRHFRITAYWKRWSTAAWQWSTWSNTPISVA